MGECTVTIVDRDMLTERLVVTVADDEVQVSRELLADWSGPDRSEHVEVNGDRVTFGTDGERVGRVTYELAHEPEPGAAWATMWRVPDA